MFLSVIYTSTISVLFIFNDSVLLGVLRFRGLMGLEPSLFAEQAGLGRTFSVFLAFSRAFVYLFYKRLLVCFAFYYNSAHLLWSLALSKYLLPQLR
jgi:hypothetical protein